ncbi:MAG TPA: DUF952 domain-containing protein [Flavobacteriales bacterium]|nr:DUF952 domain-containing protein [Flavobacteriales bacterium]HPH83748.1 DUF952 domain-containing protein [Flavobacteriales bacterium]
MPPPRFIYHIVLSKEWAKQATLPEYEAASLDNEGFIHCSRLEQLPATLKRFFAKQLDQVSILKIDTTLINVPLIYEAADDGSGFFPHLFGGIAHRSVVEVLIPPFDFMPPTPQTKADK